MKRFLALMLALVLCLSCCHALAEQEENPWSGLDLSEYVEINFFVPGFGFEDFDEIMELANARMKELINTKVNVTFVPYGDYGTKLSLFLAGDEDVDLVYGAYWLDFAGYARNGGYKGFDWDFVEKYMPLTAKNQAPTSWNEVRFNGLYHGVTNNHAGIGFGGTWTRQELLDKYGFKAEDIDNYDKMIEYLYAVAKDATTTGIYPINAQNSYPMDGGWFTGRNHMMDTNAGTALWLVWKYNTGKPFAYEDFKWFADTDEYRQFCLQMADFYKNGVFPSSVMNNDTLIDDNFYNGTSAILGALPNNYKTIQDSVKEGTPVFLNNGWDDECVTRRGNYMIYATCFTNNSKHTERAAVALDCMKNDPIVNRLLVGGIEGRHYTLTEDGKHYIPGPESADFPWNAFANNAAIQNDSNPTQLMDAEYQKYQDMYEAAEVPADTFPINGFNYDASKYDAELSALNALFSEYRFAFGFGLFGDQTEAKLDEFIAQCKALGIDEIVKDYRQQMQAFNEAK